jgi:adenylate cyclase
VQDEITQEIIAALKIKLSKAERALIAGSGTKNVDAHDFFLRGRELLLANKRDRETFERSTVYLRKAIELDPNYGGPYAGLGMAYMLDYQNHWSETPEKSLDEAVRLINESIARDDQDPFAHYVASVIYLWKRDYERSAGEAETALTLNPNYALALNARGFVYIYTGEPARAITSIEQAIRLDPVQPLYRHFLGTAHLLAGN